VIFASTLAKLGGANTANTSSSNRITSATRIRIMLFNVRNPYRTFGALIAFPIMHIAAQSLHKRALIEAQSLHNRFITMVSNNPFK
jgi:hypothetical protein